MDSSIFYLFIYFSDYCIDYSFVSETFKGAKGSTLGERIAERSAVWKSLGAEKREVCYQFRGVFVLI